MVKTLTAERERERESREGEAFESEHFSIRSEMQEINNLEKGQILLAHNVSASTSVHYSEVDLLQATMFRW